MSSWHRQLCSICLRSCCSPASESRGVLLSMILACAPAPLYILKTIDVVLTSVGIFAVSNPSSSSAKNPVVYSDEQKMTHRTYTADFNLARFSLWFARYLTICSMLICLVIHALTGAWYHIQALGKHFSFPSALLHMSSP